MDELMLSIYVATFNHEKYIKKAIESILMQKTNYKFDVWIGEDCSTDNTRNVLFELEKKLPDNYHILYREHNMHNEPISNVRDLKSHCNGKYIIALEGDDYWIDENKIQRQISFLEENQDYIAVSHDCIVVGDDNELLNDTYPSCHKQRYSFKQFASEIMPGQLCTVMYRNPKYYSNSYDIQYFNGSIRRPSDRALYFWLLCNGNIYCMPSQMSAYRHITTHGSSWSANYKYIFDNWDQLYSGFLDYAILVKHREGLLVSEFLVLKNLLKGYKEKQCGFIYLISKWCGLPHKLRPIIYYIKYRINRNILKKDEWI